MARKIPEGRFEELVVCATRVFIQHGYRRTQMADIAEALGVAKGTLYLYVESKDALFDLALRYADAPGRIAKPDLLPLPTPAPGATVAYVRDRLQAQQALPALTEALEGTGSNVPAAEIEGIVRELFGVLTRNRCGIKLLDSSAPDHPELAALWFEGGRGGLMAALEEYLRRGIDSRRLQPVPDVPTAARLIIETAVFWAVHRHWDPHPQEISDSVAEDTVVRFVVGTLTKE